MNKVLKNASWIIICRVVQAILALIISMITARYLGPSNYGLINYAMSVVAFAIPLMKLGLSSILVQEFVTFPEMEGETLGTSIVLSFISSIICVLGVNGFVFLTNSNETETIIVCALYSSVLIFQVFELFNYWFQAQLKAKYSSIVALCAYLGVSVYKVFLLITKKNIYWFSLANTIDFLIIAIGLWGIYKKQGNQRLLFSWERGKKLLSLSKYYIISDLMVVIFVQTDKVMLKAMLDKTATGYYSAAITCVGMTQFIFVAIIDSLRTTIFESKKMSDEKYELNLARLFSVVTYFSLIQSLVMTILAPVIVLILYGKDYNPAIPILQIAVWYTMFSYLGSARNIWLLAENKQKYLWKINLFGVFANIILNAVLIPLMGVNGAAIASLVTQFFTNVATGFFISSIRDLNGIIIKGFDPKFFRTNVKGIIEELQKSKIKKL